MLSFFPLDVLDEIWDLIESVFEGFLTYSFFIELSSYYLGDNWSSVYACFNKATGAFMPLRPVTMAST